MAKYIDISENDGVKIYSRSSDGDKTFRYEKKPCNFKVSEFACHDGTDGIKIDSKLIIMLQRIRDHFGAPVVINSAYRTPEYNKKIGGAKYSKHIYGQAADICIKSSVPLLIAQYAETDCEFIRGIGLYTWGCHLDTRAQKYYWDNRSGKEIPVQSFLGNSKPSLAVPILKGGSKGFQVQLLQKDLNYIGYSLQVDAIYGKLTENAIKAFQKDANITDDGIYGYQTRGALQKRMNEV